MVCVGVRVVNGRGGRVGSGYSYSARPGQPRRVAVLTSDAGSNGKDEYTPLMLVHFMTQILIVALFLGSEFGVGSWYGYEAWSGQLRFTDISAPGVGGLARARALPSCVNLALLDFVTFLLHGIALMYMLS